MGKTPLEHALNVNSSVFIQACAGAGKTFALTKRYAAVLDDFARKAALGEAYEQIDPKRILVITFTKKAAGEMIERINKDVAVLLSGREIEEMRAQGIDFCPVLRKSRDRAVRNYTTRLKDTFSENSISTIDSFCSNLIKEFAHKINLDPQFTLQEEAESQRLLDESLEKWLKEEIRQDPHVFDILLEELSFEQIRRVIRTLYGSREVLNEYAQRIREGSPEAIWRDWLERYLPEADITGLADAFEDLRNNARTLCSDRNDNLYMAIENIYNEYCMLDRSDLPEFKAAFLSVLRNSVFLTKNKEYRKNTPGKQQNWKDAKTSAETWLDLLKSIDIHELMESPGPQDKKIIPLLKKLLVQFERFNGFYSDIKTARNVLDFSDVIIKTHELLSTNGNVRKQAGKRYCHIMLDEFQDTNPMRWEIVKMIFEAGDDSKLFIVGDRKQSIYRFNYADVTVMNEAETLVSRAGGKILDFNDNYRSSKTFIEEGVNPLIGRILPPKESVIEAYEADFQATVHKIVKENIDPALEMHWCDIPDEKDDCNYSALHAAKHVQRLLKEYENSPIDQGDKPLIGVLFRKFTNINDYLQVFRRFNIPIAIVGGKGFYKTAPVLDIYHFLSVLDNTQDDHALAGLLRSPFIGLPDPAIHRLSGRKDKNETLIDAMKDDPELREIRELIFSWVEAAGKMPLDELIGGILDSDYRELGYVSELLPRQQLANLDKAVNIIRGMQRKGNTLREIREYFYYQTAHESNEAQAVCPGSAKVHLLTIHKAKGLEYPIVVLPEMNSKGNAVKDNIRFGRSGGHAEISLSLSGREKPGILLKLKAVGDKEEEAEEKRVFYVALTRAVYKACFLGEGKNKCESNTWWHKYILKPHGLIDENDKALEPGEWPRELINRMHYEALQAASLTEEHKTKDWREDVFSEAPGMYRYRSPHDLMDDKGISGSQGNGPVAGMALGSLYHLCLERNCFDISVQRDDLTALIKEQFPEADTKTLFEKAEILLNTTKASNLYQILQNSAVEKYHELPLKGWLKRGRDIVQVNGTLDLLYREKNKWVVLDFKTDKNKDRLYAYQKQLMTYQWMLKQVHGIDAAAKLFFVSLNEILDVQWDDAYFESLPLGPGFSPGLPDCNIAAEPLLSNLKEGKHLLFCASGHHEEQIYLALVRSGKMRPDIRVTTLNKWVGSFPGGGISQDRLRLMIRNSDAALKPGTADYLAKAFREHELKKGEIRPAFADLYERIKKTPAYIRADRPYRTADIAGIRIAFVDMPPPDAPEKELIAKLRSENDCFDCSLLPKTPEKRYGLIEAFSPREEVLAVAKHILDHPAKGDNILITVSSMEKYAAHLKRLFPQAGLRARFTDMQPLNGYPLSTLILNMVKLSGFSALSWRDLAPVLLHPLMNPAPELLRYDKTVRSMPWEEIPLPQTAADFIKKYHSKTPEDLKKKIECFIRDQQLDGVCGENRLCEKILQILDDVVRDFDHIYHNYRISAVYQEMKMRTDKAGFPRRDQPNGIPVVGFLDSLGSVPDRLYVMGMVEGEIPRPENENPCLSRKEKRSLELNRHFMRYWEALGSRVLFTYSRYAEDGTEQNRSVFLRDLDTVKIDVDEAGRRAMLLEYDSSLIRKNDHRMIRRHNEITGDGKDVFSGRVENVVKEFRLPVTGIDTLLACPMRFYFDRILKLQPADQSEVKYRAMKKGTVIHKAFEYFTEEGGFSLTPGNAAELIKKCLFRVFDEENINIDDPFKADLFRDYIRDLEPGSETNGLVKILKDVHDLFSDYSIVLAEKDFNNFRMQYDDISVYLNGRIDKIMIDETGKRLIAADYKTGNVNLSGLNKMMLSQLYLYTRKCKADYPGYETKAAYELIGDIDNTKIVVFTEGSGSFTQENSRNGNAFDIDEFEKYLKTLFLQISEGKYYITERPFRNACENCPHEGLCRKSTRLRNVI